jgi:RNA polymerase sigma-70 factor (ECF subfamily)
MKQRDERRGRFPTTRWSLVDRASHPAAPATGTAALGELLRCYMPALRTHLISTMRIDLHRAEDLLQGFLAEKVLEKNLIALADPARGKFRTFLLRSLERFVIDTIRYDSAQTRAPAKKLLDIEGQAGQLTTRQTPSHAFDRAWAGQVLAEVTRRLRDECHATTRPHLWEIFEARMLMPITDGSEPTAHEELSRRHGLESATQSANALGSAKRMFTKHFRAVVSEYSEGESEIDAEIRELWEIFARPTA